LSGRLGLAAHAGDLGPRGGHLGGLELLRQRLLHHLERGGAELGPLSRRLERLLELVKERDGMALQAVVAIRLPIAP
jgi:hypothetical protein